MTYPEPFDFPLPHPTFTMLKDYEDVSGAAGGLSYQITVQKDTVVEGIAYIRDLVLVRDGSYVVWVHKADLAPA
jgi:hypothetical protein